MVKAMFMAQLKAGCETFDCCDVYATLLFVLL